MKNMLALTLLLISTTARAAVVGRVALAEPMAAHVQAVMPFAGQPTLMAGALTRSISDLGATRESQLAARLLIEAIGTGDTSRMAAYMAPAARAAVTPSMPDSAPSLAAPGAPSLTLPAPPQAPRAHAPAGADEALVMAQVRHLAGSLPAQLAKMEFSMAASPTAQRIHKALNIGSNADLDALVAQTFDGNELHDALADTPRPSQAVLAAPAQAGRRHPLASLGRFIPRVGPRARPAIETAAPPAAIDATAAPARRASQAETLLARAEQLRDSGAHPVTGHVVELARLLPDHLAYARRAILKQKVDQGRLAILEEFERESAEKSLRGGFSYQYWNDFNYRLSILMTPENKRTNVAGGRPDAFATELLRGGGWRTEAGFREAARRVPGDGWGKYSAQDIAKSFPTRVMLPFIDGEIPTEEMNAMFGTKVGILGLIDGPMRVDGREMWPDHFYRHDHVHGSNEEFAEMRYELSDQELTTLRRNYLGWRGTLSGDRSMAFEFAYHIATHELPLADDLIRSGGTHLTRRDDLVKLLRDRDWYAGHAPAWALESDAAARRFIEMADAETAAFSRHFYGGR